MSDADLPECGVARFLLLFDGPWATLIVRELLHGPRRFGELRASLPGISAHTLTSRLRMFESRGIVTRRAYPEVPPRVVYELTDLGKGLRPVLDAMNEWGASAPASAFASPHPGAGDLVDAGQPPHRDRGATGIPALRGNRSRAGHRLCCHEACSFWFGRPSRGCEVARRAVSPPARLLGPPRFPHHSAVARSYRSCWPDNGVGVAPPPARRGVPGTRASAVGGGAAPTALRHR